MQPAEFFESATPPDAVVVGTLTGVQPGESTEFCMYVQGCLSQHNVDTVIQVDRLLGGAAEPSGVLAVPWGMDYLGPDAIADATSADVADLALEEVAPVGARVLVFLVKDDATGEWAPIEPSGIVVEDPDGVAIAQPDPTAPDLSIDFDDYVAEVERLLAAG